MRIVAVCGSLRARSSNLALLRAAATIAPSGMELTLYEGMGNLPQFNPDLDGEGDTPPPEVAAWRSLLASADGILFSTPEYVHGLPGALKNALDWIVSSGEFSKKPVLVLNAAVAGADRAQAALIETLQVMEADVLLDASLVTPFVGQRLDPGRPVEDAEVLAKLRASLAALASAIAACADAKSAGAKGEP